jgi:hypothetical protein
VTVDVTAATVTVVSPETSAAIGAYAGTYAIQWTASDTVGLKSTPITLYFSSDSGVTWSEIVTGLANSGSYSWTVNEVDSTTCRISVEAEDLAGGSGFASSGNFTVDATSPEVTSVEAETTAGFVNIDSNIIIHFSEPMTTASVEAVFSITPTLSGTFSWSNGDRTLTFDPATDLAEGTAYTITLGRGAQDVLGNQLAAVFTYAFNSVTGDDEAPKIIIKTSGVTLKSGDYMDKRPDISVSITDNVALDDSSFNLTLDGAALTYTTLSFTTTALEIETTPTADLAEGDHTIRAWISDTSGNMTTKEVSDLTVTYDPVSVVGEIAIHPRNFAPSSGEKLKIAYHLTADSELNHYIVGPSGERHWSRRSYPGGPGGKAGYNEIEYDGVSDVTQRPLANGIYVYMLISGNKSIKRGHIVIYE